MRNPFHHPLARRTAAVQPRKRRSVLGMTLQDLLIIVGFGSSTILAMSIVYPMVQTSIWANATQDQLTDLGHRMNSVLAAQWTTDKAHQAGLLPDAWFKDDSQHATSAWGGRIALSETPAFQPVVAFASVPKKLCDKLVSAVTTDWPDLQVNAQPVRGNDVTSRQAACQDLNTVVYIHRMG